VQIHDSRFDSASISDYARIGDPQATALVSQAGSIGSRAGYRSGGVSDHLRMVKGRSRRVAVFCTGYRSNTRNMALWTNGHPMRSEGKLTPPRKRSIAPALGVTVGIAKRA
jgi:hypothetical protein